MTGATRARVGIITIPNQPSPGGRRALVRQLRDPGRGDQLTAYEDLLDRVVLHSPSVPPLVAADSEDRFRQTVAALAPV